MTAVERSYSPIWPTAQGVPLLTAHIKQHPADFIVEEQLPFIPTGTGEHILLQIQKSCLNTPDVARRIAQCARLSERQVSYAGLKDKQAITTQWFSVQVPIKASPDWSNLNTANMTVLQSVRHDRKLRRGAVAHNRFQIILRDVKSNVEALSEHITQRIATGVPNYFGTQRFGKEARNVLQALRLFQQAIHPPRFERGIYLSAARAWLFNQVLARRIVDHAWDRPLLGDIYWLEGTKRFFSSEILDETLQQRVIQGDIHPTGPLWGSGELATHHAVKELETQVILHDSELAEGLAAAGLEQDRRPLRVIPQQLQITHDITTRTLTLGFVLPAGAYATAVLREFVTCSELGLEPDMELS